jgi:toxin-antitoxin system PIN domain toxin
VAFLRIATHRRVWQFPMSAEEALGAMRNLLGARSVFIASPTDAHWDTLEATVRQGQANGSLVSDAHLAALAVEHGATLVTFDRDFARFPALKLLNLLDEPAM